MPDMVLEEYVVSATSGRSSGIFIICISIRINHNVFAKSPPEFCSESTRLNIFIKVMDMRFHNIQFT